MVSTNLWSKTKYFSEKENWGCADKMNWALVLTLDEIRSRMPAGCMVKINCGYEKAGHEETSFHSRHDKGCAVDFVVIGMSLKQAFTFLYNNLEKMNINYGLGVYPQWNTPGFHLDLRNDTLYWIREDGLYRYSSGPAWVMDELKQLED